MHYHLIGWLLSLKNGAFIGMSVTGDAFHIFSWGHQYVDKRGPRAGKLTKLVR
jgi:hypothetical protein